MSERNRFTVFTKPWKTPLVELAEHVASLGFGGVELPVRPGFQVEPENVSAGLPRAVEAFADHGLRISSIAAAADERIIEACAAAGVNIIRLMVHVPEGASYMATMAEAIAGFEKLVPTLDRCGVKIGVQNHCNREVSSTMGLRYLVERFDPKHVGAVLDIGHCGLAGESADQAIDMVEGRLCLVNLKNAFRRRANGPEAETAHWEIYATTGRHGLADWSQAVSELQKRGYSGDVCLTAEYTDADAVDRLIAEDLAFARSLFERFDGDSDDSPQ